eukprot:GFKZ01000317.1.p1 GENE.GFKZ01000317.1~~GFKZ01000317.1.p1  ORF type:complete len:552 (-),score=94.44 GFKZ01000317.1:467-2122(-)
MPQPTSSASVASLHARIRQLEVDNASLSHAASEAAALVEEYAADAAAYRRSHPADTHVVTELTDAARRKDLRIQRLTSSLDAERGRSRQMQQRLRELEEMLQIGDEMEKTLKQSLDIMNKNKRVASREEGLEERTQVWKLALNGLKACMPEGVLGEEFDGLDALKTGIEALGTSKRLENSLSGCSFQWETDFTAVVSNGCVAVERALRWCFEEPATRGTIVMAEMSNWKVRLGKVAEAVETGEAIRWTAEFANMKKGLLEMAVERLDGIVPRVYVAVVNAGLDVLLRDLQDSWQNRAKKVRQELRLVQNGVENGDDVLSLQKKLDITRNTLSRRTNELEDVRVRLQVFEGRLQEAVREGKQLAVCKQRVAELEKLLSIEKDAVTETQNNGDSKQSHGGGFERSRASADQAAHRHYKEVEASNEASRLRRVLIKRHLADLRTRARSAAVVQVETPEKNAEYRKAMRKTIENVRLSASNASIVKLDPETLLPKEHMKSRQAEMPNKDGMPSSEILYNNREKNARDVRREEIVLGPAGQDYSSVISALRLSFPH